MSAERIAEFIREHDGCGARVVHGGEYIEVFMTDEALDTLELIEASVAAAREWLRY